MRKQCNIIVSDWERTDVIQQFVPLAKTLLADNGELLSREDSTATNESNDLQLARRLAVLTAHLLQFSEDAFGINSGSETAAKLPATLFRDFSVNTNATSSLLFILRETLALKSQHQWTWQDFDIRNKPEHKSTLAQFFHSLFEKLKTAGYIPERRIYLHSQLDTETRQRLERFLQQRGHHFNAVLINQNTVSASNGPRDEFDAAVNDAHATHIVYPDPPHLRSDANSDDEATDYLRTLEIRGNRALVHWWYYPDSYDQWIPAADVVGSPINTSPQQPFKIHARFLDDTMRFNEWMNEEDYSDFDDDAPIDGDAAAATALDDSLTEDIIIEYDANDSTDTALSRKEAAEAAPANQHRGNNKRKRQHAVQRHHTRSSDQTDDESDSSAKRARLSPPPAPQNEQKPSVAVQPAHANWFSLDTIHDIERRSLPEFFTSDSTASARGTTKTADMYRTYRNHMVLAYRSAPHVYLSATACRALLSGDVAAILRYLSLSLSLSLCVRYMEAMSRVHGFLEHWGLINYSVAAEPSTVSLPIPTSISALTQSVGTTTSTLAEADTEANASNRPTVVINTHRAPGSDAIYKSELLTVRRPAVADRGFLQPVISTTQPTRSGQDAGTSSSSSTPLIGSDAQYVSDWSDEETLRLLDALEKFGDNWNAVAAAVGGHRTRDACIAHFLRLPIEDRFMSDEVLPPHPPTTAALQPSPFGPAPILKVSQPSTPASASGSATGSSETAAPTTMPIPFADASNPVMATVAFLASAVSPQIAAQAAQAALRSFEKAATAAISQPNKSTAPGSDPGSGSGSGSGTTNTTTANATLDEGFDLSKSSVKYVAASALATASARALVFAEREEREMQRLAAQIVEKQLRKLEMKLRLLEAVDGMLANERAQLSAARNQLYADRLALARAAVSGGSGSDSTPATTPAATPVVAETSMDVDNTAGVEPPSQAQSL